MNAQTPSISPWLSPSRAWSLLKCPASVGSPDAGDKWSQPYEPFESGEANAGTLAHRALARWVRQKGYEAKDPKETLASSTDSCLADLGGVAPPRWTLVRARLLARAPLLVELIGERQAEDIYPEATLFDEETGLRGTPDLLLLGAETLLLDLKTQTIRDEIPEWVLFQLNLYSHLVKVTFDKLPDGVEIFSLNRGRVPVNITDSSVRAALEGVAAARASEGMGPRPAPDVCFFCTRRFACQAHWDVSVEWPDSDCVSGDIRRIEVAANGLTAVLVDEGVQESWVNGVPAQKINMGKRGDRIRFVRLHRVVADAEPRIKEWRWRSVSDLRFELPNHNGVG